MTNCVVFHWERWTVSRKEMDVGCDSGILALGCARIPVESFGLRTEARIRLNEMNGIYGSDEPDCKTQNSQMQFCFRSFVVFE